MLLVFLFIAIADFLIGTFIPRDGTMSEDRDRGFTGYSGTHCCYCFLIKWEVVCVITYSTLTCMYCRDLGFSVAPADMK